MGQTSFAQTPAATTSLSSKMPASACDPLNPAEVPMCAIETATAPNAQAPLSSPPAPLVAASSSPAPVGPASAKLIAAATVSTEVDVDAVGLLVLEDGRVDMRLLSYICPNWRIW
jgi:hypothetical protein